MPAMKSETPEQIAARIVDERLDEMMSPHQYASTRGLLIIDIVQALRNERERAARVAETEAAIRCMRHQKTGKGVCGYEISRAIREER